MFKQRKIPKRIRHESDDVNFGVSDQQVRNALILMDPFEKEIQVDTIPSNELPQYSTSQIVSTEEQLKEIISHSILDTNPLIFSNNQIFLDNFADSKFGSQPELSSPPQAIPLVSSSSLEESPSRKDEPTSSSSKRHKTMVNSTPPSITIPSLQEVFPEITLPTDSSTVSGVLHMLRTAPRNDETESPSIDSLKQSMKIQGNAFHATKQGLRRREQIFKQQQKKQSKLWK